MTNINRPELDEVAMNPTEFGKAVSTGHEAGVLVGFEFEVCIPEKVKDLELANKDDLAEIRKYWDDFIQNGSPEFGEFDRVFKFKKPIEGATSLKDFYKKQLEKYVTAGKALFEQIPEQIRKTLVPRTMTSIRHDWSWKRAEAKGKQNSPEMKAMFLREFRSKLRDINDPTAQAWYQKLSDLSDLVEPNSNLDNITRLLGFGSNSKKFLDHLDIPNPKTAFELMSDDLYLDDDEYDGDYGTFSKILADQLEPLMGRKVQVFSGYHQDVKNMKDWYIEPDGSLEADNSGDGTAEIVSPPLPALDAVDALGKFYGMAGQLGLYTNSTTGLHINVSIPAELDVLKLAVFLGEEHVLRDYQREDNDYVESVIRSLKDEIRNDSYKNYASTKTANRKKDIFGKPRQTTKLDFKELKDLVYNISDNHTASISNNRKYISFRHAGGDYLADYNKVYHTVGRFIRAMIIASTPKLYRNEYLKKLTQLLQPAINRAQVHGRSEAIMSFINHIRTKGLSVPVFSYCGSPSNATQTVPRLNNAVNWADLSILRSMIYHNSDVTALPQAAGKANILKHIINDNINDEIRKNIETLPDNKFASYMYIPINQAAVESMVRYKQDFNQVFRMRDGNRKTRGYAVATLEQLPASHPAVRKLLYSLLKDYKYYKNDEYYDE